MGGKEATSNEELPLGRLSEEDSELARAVATGDTRVAGKLYVRLIGVIDHAVVRVLGERGDDHEDVVQSCFEQVISTLARGKFRGNCSLATWADRVSSNVALNVVRSRVNRRSVFDDTKEVEASAATEDGEDKAQSRIELMRVRGVLARMNRRRAEVLILHDMHGHQLSEIAAMLEITVGAAQSRLVRGRKEFLRRLGSRSAASDGGTP